MTGRPSALQPRHMISYRIVPARRLVLVTMNSSPSAAEISANQATLRADPDFDPAYALVVDFSKASFADIQPADVRRHAEQDPFDATSPRAIVVQQAADRSIVRMFGTYRELSGHNTPVEAFASMAEALAWIDGLRATATDSRATTRLD